MFWTPDWGRYSRNSWKNQPYGVGRSESYIVEAIGISLHLYTIDYKRIRVIFLRVIQPQSARGFGFFHTHEQNKDSPQTPDTKQQCKQWVSLDESRVKESQVDLSANKVIDCFLFCESCQPFFLCVVPTRFGASSWSFRTSRVPWRCCGKPSIVRSFC